MHACMHAYKHCMIAPKMGGCACAGIGRTGTFCAVDIALQRLRSGDYGVAVGAAELKPVVAELRRQRAGMVQTAEQYLFCYRVRSIPSSEKRVDATSKASEETAEQYLFCYRVRFITSSETRMDVTGKAFGVQFFGRLSLPASP